jgi:hypothetical protein
VSALSPVRRGALPAEQWDAFVEAQPHGWFFHTSRWLDYGLAYSPGASDLSVAYVGADGAVESVVPLLAGPDGRFVNGGQPLCAPLGALPPLLHGMAGRPGQVLSVTPLTPTQLWSTYVVDLAPDEATLWRGLRKSYKSLIHRVSEGDGCVSVLGAGHAEWIRVAQRLHLQSAGRQTRSDETWAMMGRWMDDGDALLAVAQRGLVYTGFAYAIRWKDWAYYASGASVERDVSHALLWHLTRALRADGRTRHFEVGWAAREGDDEKARGIAHFKAGFGGTLWPVMQLREEE